MGLRVNEGDYCVEMTCNRHGHSKLAYYCHVWQIDAVHRNEADVHDLREVL